MDWPVTLVRGADPPFRPPPPSDHAAAVSADEGDVPAEPGETRVQLPSASQTRRGEHDHKVAAETQDHQVGADTWRPAHVPARPGSLACSNVSLHNYKPVSGYYNLTETVIHTHVTLECKSQIPWMGLSSV